LVGVSLGECIQGEILWGAASETSQIDYQQHLAGVIAERAQGGILNVFRGKVVERRLVLPWSLTVGEEWARTGRAIVGLGFGPVTGGRKRREDPRVLGISVGPNRVLRPV